MTANGAGDGDGDGNVDVHVDVDFDIDIDVDVDVDVDVHIGMATGTAAVTAMSQWRGRATTPAAQMVPWMATVMAAHSPRGSKSGLSSWRKAFSGFGHIFCLEIAGPVLCWPDSFLFLMAALMVQAMAIVMAGMLITSLPRLPASHTVAVTRYA